MTKKEEIRKTQIRCVALDLDRTSLDTNGNLSPATGKALSRSIAAGVEIVVASGRPYAALPAQVRTFPGIRYAITSNGACIHAVPSGERLHGFLLDAHAVEQIVYLTEHLPVVYECFIDGVGYAEADYVRHPENYGLTPYGVNYVKNNRTAMEDMPSYIREHSAQLDALDLVVLEEAYAEGIRRLLSSAFPTIYLTSSSKSVLEISAAESGKHKSFAHLLRMLKINPNETAAFGDGDNDSELLAYAGVGIAMANASEGCKKAADYVTLSNSEDGVAYAMEHYLHLFGS